jgi:hypothetical protein
MFQELYRAFRNLRRPAASQLPDAEPRFGFASQPISRPLPEPQEQFDTFRTDDLGKLLGDLATTLWRLRSSLTDAKTNEPFAEARRAWRYADSMWDRLASAGVTVYDLTGRDFDSGMSLKVIAFQPTAGVTSERIIETLRPAVFFHDVPVQMAEVIVATPESVRSAEEGEIV